MTDEEKKQRHREIARESARRKNGYYEKEHKGKKEVRKPVVDLSNFDVWYEMNYIKGQNIQPPKVISFKEHIRVLFERDNQYEYLLNAYNELVEAYNELKEQLEGKIDEFTFSKAVEVMNEYDNLKKENAELSNSVTELTNSKIELENKVTELKKQIEKMKCCGNCKHCEFKIVSDGSTRAICTRLKGDVCLSNNYDEWELAE